MKKYQVFAISRYYYSITVDARSKEEALYKIEKSKNAEFKLERIDPVEILENSVQLINADEKSNNL